ncbi:MAG: phosphatase PAP2 family protein [Verrucomicrobiales bacterium]
MLPDLDSENGDSASDGDKDHNLPATRSVVRAFFLSIWSLSLEFYYLAGTAVWKSRFRILGAAAVLVIVELPLIRFGDPIVMAWLPSWRTSGVVELASWLSFLGEFQMVPLALVTGIWFWCEKTRRTDCRVALGATVIAMVWAGILVQLPKFVFGRPRPHFNLPDQFAWFHPEWNSFPSGHAAHWFALVGALWAFSPRLSLMVIPLAVTVSLARVLALAHYPSDLLAGAGFGLFFGVFFGLAARSLNLKLAGPTPL